MTLWYRALFVFSSFGPLYLLLSAALVTQLLFGGGELSASSRVAIFVSLLAFLLSIIVFLCIVLGFRRSSPSWFPADPTETLDEGILAYMISYFPPLMIDDFLSPAKVVPVAVFYTVLLAILLGSNATYVHPYFLLFGYRIYRMRLPSKRLVIVVTKADEFLPGDRLRFYEVQSGRMFFADEGD